MVRKFEEQLVSSGHSSLCPWKDNPVRFSPVLFFRQRVQKDNNSNSLYPQVPKSLLSLPGSSTHEVMGAFRQRLRSLTRCKVLPVIAPDFIQVPPFLSSFSPSSLPPT